MAAQTDLKPEWEHLLRSLWLSENEEQGEEVPTGSQAWSEEIVVALRGERLIEADNGSLRLSADGERAAASIIRRYRLAERLLADVLQMPLTSLHRETCAFEHILHPSVEQRICTLLGHPTTCPHRHPIPAGDCCLQSRPSGPRLMVPLSEMRPQETGAVAYLATTADRELQKLTALGVLPGNPVRLLRRSPSYVFEMGHSQYAIDAELARSIFVRLEEE